MKFSVGLQLTGTCAAFLDVRQHGVSYIQGGGGGRKKKESTDHSALLVREVDADGAAGLGVGHLAVVGGAALAGEALDQGRREARALEGGVLHSEAVAQGLPRSLEVLH